MSFFQYHVYWPYVRRMTRIAPLNYLDYDKAKAISELEQQYSWRYYGGKHFESRWTKFFQSYFLPEKFGYDKRRAHLSSMIVAGQMTRDEALAELRQPLYLEREIDDEKQYISRKLGIPSDELERLIALPKRTFRDYPNNHRLLSNLLALRTSFRSWRISGRRDQRSSVAGP